MTESSSGSARSTQPTDVRHGGAPAWLVTLRMFGGGAVVALLVASIDWGGLDRTLMGRFSAGLWAFLATTALIDALMSRRSGLPRPHFAYSVYGAVGAGCMTISQLVSGLMAGAFLMAAAGWMVASLVAVRKYTREVRQNTPALVPPS